ncbi:MAG TPA: hypothetical protein VGI53_07575 [Dyella sp.]
MTDINALISRTVASTRRCTTSITEAIRHVHQARQLAIEAGCAPKITAALERAERNLHDAQHDTRNHRRHLLRKADRMTKPHA